jgi:hypothetical protein
MSKPWRGFVSAKENGGEKKNILLLLNLYVPFRI